MEADIIQNLLNFTLTDAEEQETVLESSDLEKGLEECQASFYVKVLMEGDNTISIKGFSINMARVWNCKEIRVNRIANSIFQVFFPTQSQCHRIKAWGPWHYDNHLLVIKDWET